MVNLGLKRLRKHGSRIKITSRYIRWAPTLLYFRKSSYNTVKMLHLQWRRGTNKIDNIFHTFTKNEAVINVLFCGKIIESKITIICSHKQKYVTFNKNIYYFTLYVPYL